MSGFVRKGFGVLGAALLVLGSLPAPALAQDEVPDLKIELVGLNQTNRREVVYKVTNVGTEWTDDTTVRFAVTQASDGRVVLGAPRVDNRTLPVGQTNPQRDKSGENPHDLLITYTLPAECDGHRITAFLAPAKTWTGLAETNVGNNRDGPGYVCPPKNPPAGPAAPAPAASEHLQVGMHVETFPPIFFGSRHEVRRGGDCIAPRPFPAAGTTGWLQQEANCGGFDEGYQSEIAQTGVSFDLSKLDEIKNLRIKSAKLKFDEAKVSWLNGDETPRPVTTCVANVALATQSLATVPNGALFPNAPKRTPRGATRMTTVWDLELDVRHDALGERGSPTRYQYVIQGEEPFLLGQDDAACMSKLTNVRLEVEYETLP